MRERCHFTGDLPAAQVRDWNRRATIAVNTSPVGLFDKIRAGEHGLRSSDGGLQSSVRVADGRV